MNKSGSIEKVGIIGCGAIGNTLAGFIDKNLASAVKALFLCDIDHLKAKTTQKAMHHIKASILNSDALIAKSDLVIECANAKVSYSLAKKALQRKKNVMVLSIGGILAKCDELFQLAEKNNRNIYLPSGAICGIDGFKALSLAGIDSAKLTTRKPPQGLEGAPYIVENKINLKSLKKETVVFKGSAFEAIKGFPANINVAALLSIVGIGAKKTQVVIIATPQSKRNVHEITVESKAGKITTVCENVPFVQNPKTSYLAALAAMSVLKNIFTSIRIGN